MSRLPDKILARAARARSIHSDEHAPKACALLVECADALDAKDAQINGLLRERAADADVLAAKDAEIARLRVALAEQLAITTPLVGENFRLQDELAALWLAVVELPEYECTGACEDNYRYTAVSLLKYWRCACYATPANAARAAARKLAGLGE